MQAENKIFWGKVYHLKIHREAPVVSEGWGRGGHHKNHI